MEKLSELVEELGTRIDNMERIISSNMIVLERFPTKPKESLYTCFARFVKDGLKVDPSSFNVNMLASVSWAGSRDCPRIKASLPVAVKEFLLSKWASSDREYNKDLEKDKKVRFFEEQSRSQLNAKKRSYHLVECLKKIESLRDTPIKVGKTGDIQVMEGGKPGKWEKAAEVAKKYGIKLATDEFIRKNRKLGTKRKGDEGQENDMTEDPSAPAAKKDRTGDE